MKVDNSKNMATAEISQIEKSGPSEINVLMPLELAHAMAVCQEIKFRIESDNAPEQNSHVVACELLSLMSLEIEGKKNCLIETQKDINYPDKKYYRRSVNK